MSITLHRFTAIATFFGIGFGLATFPREEYDRACRDAGRLWATGLMAANGVAMGVMFLAGGVAIESSIEHVSDPGVASAVVAVIGFVVGTAFFAK